MENAIIKLTEELVNAQENVTELRAIKSELNYNFRAVTDRLNKLIEVILNNSRLNYNDTGLSLKDDSEIIQYVKFIDPYSYNDRLEELKKEAQERDNAAANLAKNLKKERKQNG